MQRQILPILEESKVALAAQIVLGSQVRWPELDNGGFAEHQERESMRKIVLGLVALAAVVAVSDPAQARDRQFSLRSQRVSRSYYNQQPVEYAQPQQGYYEQEQRPSFLGGLVDMERRKNAWLRQTFFGQ